MIEAAQNCAQQTKQDKKACDCCPTDADFDAIHMSRVFMEAIFEFGRTIGPVDEFSVEEKETLLKELPRALEIMLDRMHGVLDSNLSTKLYQLKVFRSALEFLQPAVLDPINYTGINEKLPGTRMKLKEIISYNKKEVDRCIENWMSTNTYVTHNPDDRYPLPDLTGVPLEHTWWSAENRAGSIESDIHIDNSLMAHPFFHRHGEPNRNKITRAEAEMLMEQRGDAVCDVCHPPPK